MIMAEKVAKTKWCPFTRLSGTNPTGLGMPAFNRKLDHVNTGLHPPSVCCLGSGCAMWKWVAESAFGHCGLIKEEL